MKSFDKNGACPHPPTRSPTHPHADGTLEDYDKDGAGAGSSKPETAEEGAARIKLEAAKARESVRCGAWCAVVGRLWSAQWQVCCSLGAW